MSAAVEIRGLRVDRGGREVLHELSLDVESGVTGLLGPSGSGKTTLMRSIVGAQVVAGGTVTVLGLSAGAPALRAPGSATRPRRRRCTRTSYVRENLDYFAAILDVSDDRVAEVVELVELAGGGRSSPSPSRAASARLSLAAALLSHPELLVLDEPAVGLDPVLGRDLWESFERLAREGTTVAVSSHVMDGRTCDSLVLMRDGGILATGTPEGLRSRTGTRDLDSAFLTP